MPISVNHTLQKTVGGVLCRYPSCGYDGQAGLLALALGALPGTPFMVERVAPLGDPVEIKLRGSSISVRKGEIEILDVEPIK